MPPKRNERHKALKFCKFLQCWGACTLFRNAKDYCKPETIALPFFFSRFTPFWRRSRQNDGDRFKCARMDELLARPAPYTATTITQLHFRPCSPLQRICRQQLARQRHYWSSAAQLYDKMHAMDGVTFRVTRDHRKWRRTMDANTLYNGVHMETASLSCTVSEITLIFIYKRIQNSAISSTVANQIVARLYTWTRYFTSMKMVEVRCRLQPSN